MRLRTRPQGQANHPSLAKAGGPSFNNEKSLKTVITPQKTNMQKWWSPIFKVQKMLRFRVWVVNIQNHISTNQFFTLSRGFVVKTSAFFQRTRELRSTSCQFQSQISSTHRAARWNRRHFRRSTYQRRKRIEVLDVWCDHPKGLEKKTISGPLFIGGPQRKKNMGKLGKNLPKLVEENWNEKSQMIFVVINFVVQFG